jgi:hypothetical protein
MAARESTANITTALRSKRTHFLPCQMRSCFGALARHPDDVAEVLLGDRNLALARAGSVSLKAHQRLGETAWQVEEHDLLRLLGGPAQLRAQYLDDPERNFRESHRPAVRPAQHRGADP